MKFKWDLLTEDQLNPQTGEIYANVQTGEIMLIEGTELSEEKNYFVYATFADDKAKRAKILQETFIELRKKERIVKTRIKTMQIERIY